jgi:hypothetical protein
MYSDKDKILKLLTDRRNHLKSKLVNLKQPKMDKYINVFVIEDVETRLKEIENILSKIKNI